MVERREVQEPGRIEDPNEEQEFKELLEQAHEIRKALTGKGGYESDSEEAYDLLVDIQLR